MADLFLDLDGTLIDPKPGITGSVIAALNRLDLPAPDADALEWVIGPPLIESFRTLGAPDPSAALALYREAYAAGGLFECRIYDGIPEALEKLRASGHRLHLATSKPLVYAERITAHLWLDRLLDSQFGTDLAGTLNDKRDLLAHALQTLGKSGGVMIGDRRFDIAAARGNGLAALAVSWGYGDAGEWAAADAICASPPLLTDAVAGLLG